jgi:hypothetical protein
MSMANKPRSALTEGLECMKATGLITKYNLIFEAAVRLLTSWSGKGPTSRRMPCGGRSRMELAGLVDQSRLIVERDETCAQL